MIANIEIQIPAWVDQANCASTDPELFFPEKGMKPTGAKIVCGRCEVRAECQQWAEDMDESFGVWGGLTEHDRRNVRAERRAAA